MARRLRLRLHHDARDATPRARRDGSPPLRVAVAIVRASANDPPLLLCDEPPGALDTENGDRVMDTLFQAQAELRTAVVIVTHDPHVAELANRILVMTEGQFAPAGD